MSIHIEEALNKYVKENIKKGYSLKSIEKGLIHYGYDADLTKRLAVYAVKHIATNIYGGVNGVLNYKQVHRDLGHKVKGR